MARCPGDPLTVSCASTFEFCRLKEAQLSLPVVGEHAVDDRAGEEIRFASEWVRCLISSFNRSGKSVRLTRCQTRRPASALSACV
jgi:hypothetical protein